MNEKALALGWAAPQTVFHLFRQCAKTAEEQNGVPMSAWHGEAAAGRGLYLGKYEFDADGLVEERDFNTLPPDVQKSLVEWGVSDQRLPPTPQNLAAERAKRQQKKVTYWPYKFVGYSEELYSELVRQGCHYSDGRVETDPAKLGRLARHARW